MLAGNRPLSLIAFAVLLLTCAAGASAREITGTITSTLTLTEDSILTGDVTCATTGATCIILGAPGITLDLNGFALTGLADPQNACSGLSTAGEVGIDVNMQRDVVIRGPGLVQRFRNQGIQLRNSTAVKIIAVTVSTNCLSGIFVNGGSDHVLEGIVAVRNGHLTSPCGGI
jgi:hypothetical protein